MLIVIYVISTAVHFFALFYMKKDPKLNLFLALLSLFTFFMVFMVTSSNLLMFFIGWEGIGILSFLLIGFWSTRWDSALSAFKAVAYNRIGDFFFICVIFITYYIFGTTSFADLQILAFYAKDFNFSFFGFNITVINLISYLLALCAGVKSAQLGFHA